MLSPFDSKNSEQSETLIQNSLPTRAPDFCSKPFWYVRGNEKVVKIGKEVFNYIDYLEAWANHDCGTYRSEESLIRIRQKIRDAFLSIEQG
jgi:hypothetical protein